MNFSGLRVVTPPERYPVSLEEVKAFCRIDATYTGEDALLVGFIASATDHAETLTRRAFMTQTVEMKLDAFPCDALQPIELPRPNLQAVNAIQYQDIDGVTRTWSDSDYTVDTTSLPGRILPAYNLVYPTTRVHIDVVTIEYVAGYGDNPADVPEMIRLAILHTIGFWYDNRNAEDVPEGAKRILKSHKIYGF